MKLLVLFFIMLSTFPLQLIAFIYGWGLEVQAWPVIIFCWIMSTILTLAAGALK